MGLTIKAKHLPYEKTYDCGYFSFMNFRLELAKTYNEEFGELYKKWIYDGLTEEECNRINELSNEDLDIFLNHSDCDGKISYKDCKKIYDVIKDFTMDMLGHNYGNMQYYNMLEQ